MKKRLLRLIVGVTSAYRKLRTGCIVSGCNLRNCLFATVARRYIGMADQKGNPRTVVLGGRDFETATTTALASSFSIAECILGSGADSSTSDRF
jgi:hypothetical protein